MKTAKVMKANDFTEVYHASKIINTNSALVAMYLNLLLQGMNDFDMKKWNDPTACPYNTPEYGYTYSQDLKLEKGLPFLDMEEPLITFVK